MNTMFKPQLRLFKMFESGEVKGFADDMEEYWGNILDFYQKMKKRPKRKRLSFRKSWRAIRNIISNWKR